ncbi:DUF3857 domain-containing protein [Winogradskyella sp. PC D3.3]
MTNKLTIVALFATFMSFSQDYNMAMSVSKSDLELNTYAKDSTASALVIYDYGNAFVDSKTFWLTVENKQKIKVLRPDGIDRGEFEVKLYKGKSSKEKIKAIKGTTYNLENGEIVKTHLTENAIFKEDNENYTLVRFVLPNVKDGSVITISYETQSQFMAKYQPWYFQDRDPVLYSEYNTSIPANYEYHIKLVGGIPFDTHDVSLKKECLRLGNGAASDCSVSKYIMKNIPAYKAEDFTTTSLNYTSRLEYELSVYNTFDGRIDKITKTWKDADHELKTDADFGRQISKKSLVKNSLPDSITAITDQLKKAKTIYNYVLDNYKWNGKSERYDVSIKTLLKENVGSAFEINLLLENLLYNEDIEVYPILMSTRGNGLATKVYPVLSDFNYVILKTIIDGKPYYLDATEPYLSFGELPFRALNQYGRLIDFDNGSQWEDIAINGFSTRAHRVDLTSFVDDQFVGNINSTYTGYHAHEPKEQYKENSSNYLEAKINNHPDIIIEKYNISDESDSTFNEDLEIAIEPEFIRNKIYLNPFIIKFFEDNPFKLQERTYPIDFGYKEIYIYSMKINLNDALKIIELPKAFNYVLPNNSGSLLFNIDLKDQVLLLYFKVKFNLPIYAPEYYPYLKTFMAKVVELQNNTVIALEKQ